MVLHSKGFRSFIKACEKKRVAHPTLKQMKRFLVEFALVDSKPIMAAMKLMAWVPWADFLLPRTFRFKYKRMDRLKK